MLPGSVGVLCVQPAVEVVGLVGHDCLVDHDYSLIHHKLLASKTSTSVFVEVKQDSPVTSLADYR